MKFTMLLFLFAVASCTDDLPLADAGNEAPLPDSITAQLDASAVVDAGPAGYIPDARTAPPPSGCNHTVLLASTKEWTIPDGRIIIPFGTITSSNGLGLLHIAEDGLGIDGETGVDTHIGAGEMLSIEFPDGAHDMFYYMSGWLDLDAEVGVTHVMRINGVDRVIPGMSDFQDATPYLPDMPVSRLDIFTYGDELRLLSLRYSTC